MWLFYKCTDLDYDKALVMLFFFLAKFTFIFIFISVKLKWSSLVLVDASSAAPRKQGSAYNSGHDLFERSPPGHKTGLIICYS